VVELPHVVSQLCRINHQLPVPHPRLELHGEPGEWGGGGASYRHPP
jgi:hypothetical protein